jgi:hypothetical protein
MFASYPYPYLIPIKQSLGANKLLTTITMLKWLNWSWSEVMMLRTPHTEISLALLFTLASEKTVYIRIAMVWYAVSFRCTYKWVPRHENTAFWNKSPWNMLEDNQRWGGTDHLQVKFDVSGRGLRWFPSSGKWRRVGRVWTEVSEDNIASMMGR